MRKSMWVGIGAAALLAAACSEQTGTTSPSMAPGKPALVQVPNAGYTTVNENYDGTGHCLNGNPAVNCNIYDGKEFVWLNGGPDGASLADGTYFFAVLSPSGQNNEVNDGPGATGDHGTPHNLSDDVDAYTARRFSISSGVVTNLGTHLFDSNKIRLADYSTTLNPGGVYIMAICEIEDPDDGNVYPVDPSSCKYDAFKVRTSGGGGGGGGDPVASGLKYYDSNTNGQWDSGEPGIPGWQINVTGGTTTTLTTVAVPAGTFDITLANGLSYVFTERQAQTFNFGGGATGYWQQTGNTVDQSVDFLNTTTLLNKIYTVGAVTDGVTTDLNFGNVCYLNPGGHTMGFWSNKNGQALETTSDFSLLTSLNLRDATGADKNFSGTLSQNKTAYASWLLSANATNMAYMLSAQLSATELSVQHGFTNASVITIGGMTVTQLMVYANSLLANPIASGTFAGQNGSYTVGSSTLRTEQEKVKTALDMINNAGGLGGFLQAAGVCPAPTFAP